MISLVDINKVIYTKALFDSGATGSVINEHVVRSIGIQTRSLHISIRLKNTSSTLNANGAITEYCEV